MDSPTAVRRTHGFRHHSERRIFRRTAFFMETTPLTNAAKSLSVPPCSHFAGSCGIRRSWNVDRFEQHRGSQPSYLDTKNTKTRKHEEEKPLRTKIKSSGK